MKHIPIFIISLQSNVGRRRRIMHRLLSLGCNKEDIHIIDATTPDTLPPLKIADIDLNEIDPFSTSKKSILLSCLDSHLKTIHHISTLDTQSALVIEDDMMFCNGFLHTIAQANHYALQNGLPLILLKWLKKNYMKDLPWFFYSQQRNFSLTKNTSDVWCTGCYWISTDHAQKISDQYYTNRTYKPIESKTSEIITMHPEHYFMEPALAIEDPNNLSTIRASNFDNEIFDSRWDVKNFNLFEDHNWNIIFAIRMTHNKQEFERLNNALDYSILDEDFKKIVEEKEKNL